jgi:hemerythrin superfamily protein
MAIAHGSRHPDAIDILEADHRAFEQLFDAFGRAGADDLERKTTLVQRTCELLTIHTLVEEELLYPEARKVLDAGHRKDVDEACVEHFLVKTLIDKFTRLRAGDDAFDPTFKVLTENVNHHVEEEESDLFPALRKTGLDLVGLGERILARKEALQRRIIETAAAG